MDKNEQSHNKGIPSAAPSHDQACRLMDAAHNLARQLWHP